MAPLSLLLAAATLPAALAAGTRSSGCGKQPSVEPGHHHKRYVNSPSGGGNRSYLLAIPSDYSPDTAVPLILSYHGNDRNATNQLYLSDFWYDPWNTLSAVSVYPQGADDHWEGAPYDPSDQPDDLAFTDDLIDALAGELCLDETRVYCSGKSVGGGFCNVIACDADLSARFAAIAPVSGAYYTTPANESFSSDCKPARGGMPVLEFHGLDDMTIPYNESEHNGVELRSIPDWAQQWANLNGCDGQEPKSVSTHDGNVVQYYWKCDGESANATSAGGIVQHYAINNLGHVWPSTGWNPDNNGNGTYIDATPLIFDFFGNFSLPASDVMSRRAMKERK